MLNKKIIEMNESERSKKIQELDEIAKSLIKQPVIFEPGEKIKDRAYISNLINYGNEGFLYAAFQVIVNKGDEEKAIKELIKTSSLEHNIVLLKKIYEHDLKDRNTNQKEIKILEEILDDYSNLTRFSLPFHNDEDFKKIAEKKGIKSEIRKIALKVLNKDKYVKEPILKDKIYKEASILSKLNHPNLIKFIDSFEHEKGIGYFVEYVHGKSVEDIFKDVVIKEKNDLPSKEVIFALAFYLYDVLDYIHKKGIIQNDIRNSNMLISLEEKEGAIFKLCDFGLSSEIGNKDYAAYGGTEIYMHPYKLKFKRGLVKNNEKYIQSPGVDIYAAGLSILEAAMGLKFPLSATSTDELDFLEPKVKDVNKYVNEKYSAEEKEVMYIVFDKKFIKPDPESLNKMPSAAEMKEKYYKLLSNLGYKSPSQIQDILRKLVEPIRESIRAHYTLPVQSTKIISGESEIA